MSGTTFLSLIERLEDWQARNSLCRNLIYMSEMFSNQGFMLWELLARS